MFYITAFYDGPKAVVIITSLRIKHIKGAKWPQLGAEAFKLFIWGCKVPVVKSYP